MVPASEHAWPVSSEGRSTSSRAGGASSHGFRTVLPAVRGVARLMCIYMDFSLIRGITLRARSLHDVAIFHEVHHRWRRASSTPASSLIQNDLISILQAAGQCTPSKCATTLPHSSAIHHDERTLLAVLLCQHHVREVTSNPAQGDAERGSQTGTD